MDSLLVFICIVTAIIDIILFIYMLVCSKIFMSDTNLYDHEKLMNDLRRWSKSIKYVRIMLTLSVFIVAGISLIILN